MGAPNSVGGKWVLPWLGVAAACPGGRVQGECLGKAAAWFVVVDAGDAARSAGPFYTVYAVCLIAVLLLACVTASASVPWAMCIVYAMPLGCVVV